MRLLRPEVGRNTGYAEAAMAGIRQVRKLREGDGGAAVYSGADGEEIGAGAFTRGHSVTDLSPPLV